MNKFLKRCSIGVLVFAIAVVSAICKINSKASEDVSSESQEVSVNSEMVQKTKQISEEFTYSMYNKEYEKVSNMYNEENRKVFTPDIMKEYGNAYFVKEQFIDIEGIYYDEYEAYIINQVIVKQKYRDMKFNLYYDKNGALLAFEFVNTKPNPEQSDYFSEEAIKVGSLEEYKMDGILTLPKNNSKAPVVILVHGSGFNDADESTGSNRLFAEIAHGLAKQGIATVRYNERFHQYPELSHTNNTVYTEAIDDACAIVDQIALDDRIDSSNIYIAGHSLGGMVAPKIAELNSKVSGIISLAGTPRKLVDVGAQQGILSIEEMEGITEDEKLKLKAEALEFIEEIRNLTVGGDDKLGLYSKDYWLSTKNLDAEGSLNKLSIPMLILQGEKDAQVYADTDYKEWQRILDGRENCEFKLYDGLNHFFTTSKGYPFDKVMEEYCIPEQVDERVVNDMAIFINKCSIK